jgi:GMP synthase-like glutamine amidotransferase
LRSEDSVVSGRLLVVEHGADAPVARLGEWLVGAGVELDVRRPYAGDELPADLSGHAGILVMGGAMGVADDAHAPWLAAVRDLLRQAVADSVPTLGVCLGGQLLAVANGGRVVADPEAQEFGAQLVAKRSAAAGDPLFGALPIMPDVIQWHFDAITELPPGAVLLASSPSCANQAYRLGRLAWGVQFHIETTPEIIAEWAADDAESLADYDLAEIVRRSVPAHDDVAETWQPFAEAFAAVLAYPDGVSEAPGSPRQSTAEPITDPAAIRAALAAEASAARVTPLPMPGVREP